MSCDIVTRSFGLIQHVDNKSLAADHCNTLFHLFIS